MKYIKLFIFFLVCASQFYSCESNDNAANAVYIPQAVNKKVLLEFFTNSGCAPCVEVHGYLDQISSNSGVTINDTSVIIISFHYKYPWPLDSLYLANTPENLQRAAYYNINSTPGVFLDGADLGKYSYSFYSDQISSEMNKTKYMSFILSNTVNQNIDTGNVSISINLVNQLPNSDSKLHVILTESEINYNASNGLKLFNDVMRDMITGADGEDITLVQGLNTINKTYSINPKWNPENCFITVYVQSSSTKAVYGVERVKVF
jgi:thiol-disulfide isomerase/thioredoxin